MIRIFSFLLLFACIACSPSQATRGNLLTQDRIESIQIGQSTKSDIVRAIGSPTTIAAFDNKTWYYIGQLTEKQGL